MIWCLAGLAVLALVLLGVSYGCFRMAFYVPDRENWDPETIETPEGEIYDPYRENMEKWIREARLLPQEHFAIRSFDGLTLRGKFYEYAPGAPIELMVHGYRGTAERDLSGGVQRCLKLGRSALLVDQRASGSSEGNVITFGIREHRDCLAWVDFMVSHFGPEVKIILTGISMGAATVMMAGGEPLPANVTGILADCGYSSPREIIREVIRQMGLPVGLSYPFVRLGAKLFGGFDLEENSPREAMRRCKVPVIFFHGDADAYVPCEMSVSCYEACASRKKLVIVSGAGHGLSYPVAPEEYRAALREFFGPEASVDNPASL
ncbi:MAG: alpha/beta hydrolase [Oscillospiraceae bacterium]|nr:alpha/beta hydrolase [Oscillospiraceae bacterium]